MFSISFSMLGTGLVLIRVDEAIDHKTNFVNLIAVESFFHPLRSDQRFIRFKKTACGYALVRA
jgi:adenylate cyclase